MMKLRTWLALGMLLAAGGAAGCAEPLNPEEYVYARRNFIPVGAELVRETRQDMSYTARKYGKVYLQNARSGRVVSSFLLPQGETFKFSPSTGTVKIGQDELKVDVSGADRYRLYFRKIHEF